MEYLIEEGIDAILRVTQNDEKITTLRKAILDYINSEDKEHTDHNLQKAIEAIKAEAEAAALAEAEAAEVAEVVETAVSVASPAATTTEVAETEVLVASPAATTAEAALAAAAEKNARNKNHSHSFFNKHHKKICVGVITVGAGVGVGFWGSKHSNYIHKIGKTIDFTHKIGANMATALILGAGTLLILGLIAAYYHKNSNNDDVTEDDVKDNTPKS